MELYLECVKKFQNSKVKKKERPIQLENGLKMERDISQISPRKKSTSKATEETRMKSMRKPYAPIRMTNIRKNNDHKY